jgi:hypothetical protein
MRTHRHQMVALLGAAAVGWALSSGATAGAEPPNPADPVAVSPEGKPYTPSTSEPEYLTPISDEEIWAQVPGRFLAWVEEKYGQSPGFVGGRLDYETKSVRLGWTQGHDVPTSIPAEADRQGVTLKLLRVRYTPADIAKATALLRTTLEQNFPEFSLGFIDYTDPSDVVLRARGVMSPGRSLASLISNVEKDPSLAGLPVRFTVISDGSKKPRSYEVLVDDSELPPIADDNASALPTRNTDWSPFNAGGFMRASVGNNWSVCSNTFGLWIAGVRHTNTADHCSRSWYYGFGSSRSYGSSYYVNSTGAGRVMQAEGAPLVFHGSITTTEVRRILSWESPVIGQYYCTSGGNTGTHCSLKVNSVTDDFGVAEGFPHAFRRYVAVSTTPGSVAAAGGDSGGAFYQRITGNFQDAIASGIIQGGSANMYGSACEPAQVDNVYCSDDVWVSRFSSHASGAGGTLVKYGP